MLAEKTVSHVKNYKRQGFDVEKWVWNLYIIFDTHFIIFVYTLLCFLRVIPTAAQQYSHSGGFTSRPTRLPAQKFVGLILLDTNIFDVNISYCQRLILNYVNKQQTYTFRVDKYEDEAVGGLTLKMMLVSGSFCFASLCSVLYPFYSLRLASA